MNEIHGYHFTKTTLRDGSKLPKIGVPLRFNGEVIWCHSGLYASETPLAAAEFAPGVLLHKVLCKEIVRQEHDKFVCRERTIIASINAEKVCENFSRWCALQVAFMWSPPDFVLDYLTTGNPKLREMALQKAISVSKDTYLPDPLLTPTRYSRTAYYAAAAASQTSKTHSAAPKGAAESSNLTRLAGINYALAKPRESIKLPTNTTREEHDSYFSNLVESEFAKGKSK